MRFSQIVFSAALLLLSGNPSTHPQDSVRCVPVEPSVDALFAHLNITQLSFNMDFEIAPRTYRYAIEVYEYGDLKSSTDIKHNVPNPEARTELRFDIVHSPSPDGKQYSVTVKHPRGFSRYPHIDFHGRGVLFTRGDAVNENAYTLPLESGLRILLASEFPDDSGPDPPPPTIANSKRALVFRLATEPDADDASHK